MPATASVSTPNDIVIPDCCNIGVVFRTLIAVNVVFLTGIMLQSPDWKTGLAKFVETSTIIELACLSSLIALCGLRQVVNKVPSWGQRLLCAGVPAALTGLIVHFLSKNVVFLDSLDALHPLSAAFVAALCGMTLQHYFEIRTRAFSPALVEARLQALQARIRPHFFFNSLNAVLSLIRTEPMRAETTLEDLADLFRVLMRDARDMTTLEREIHLCQQYLSVEKIRLGERLQVRWHTVDLSEEVMRRAQIPSLLLQPLLENAVHYGVEPACTPALIQIEMSRQIDRIEIVVVNPYYGDASVSEGNHMALNNIRQRLALLYDVEGQLTTTIAKGFFEVKLRFPYVKTEKDS